MAAENPANPGELQKPVGTPQAEEVVIHVIPEKFYGAALRKKVVPEKPPAVPPPAPVAPPPGMPPVPPPAKKKSKAPLVIILIVVLLLGGGGAAAFFLLRKPPAKVNKNANVNVAKAVCGDAKCDRGSETAQSCPADCGPAAPVCGDAKCESPDETPTTCAVDCGPKPAVCGNDACEDGEDLDSCPADCTPPEPEPGPDSDSDGLSDAEEAMYGTNPQDPNTDHDSFVDLNELLNLFDPARPAPAMLQDSSAVAVYLNDDLGYSVFRPAAWTVEEKDGKREAYFRARTGEFIEVLAQQKAASQPLMDWFLAQAPNVRSSDVEIFRTKQGLEEIMSPDKLTAFVDGGDRVLVVTYSLGIQTVLNYKITHQMIVNSLKITGPATFPPPEEPAPAPVPEPSPAPATEPAPEATTEPVPETTPGPEAPSATEPAPEATTEPAPPPPSDIPPPEPPAAP